MGKQYWLLKTEAESYPIEQLQKDKKTPWTGVRNFRARNFMRDDMKVGDLCLFYHSMEKNKGVYGIAKVASKPYPDPTQFDKKSDYFEPRATREKPVWILVDIAFVKILKKPVLASEMKIDPKLKNMLLWKIQRLSIQPVSEKEFKHIEQLGE
jgi:predicted RNA-binding protein with PUA-like domain